MTVTFPFRDRVIRSTNDLFAHAPYPLDRTGQYRGDAGLFGPDCVTWPVMGDASVFVGGIRALLVQAAHPEVVAGVFDHSRFRDDPLGRLSRTSAYVTATAFGALPEVERAVAIVSRSHRPISGLSPRGREYSASAPALAAWVHNALADSFLSCYQHLGPRTLTQREADQFVAEQARVGALLGATPLPQTAASLADWLDGVPELAPSRQMVEAVGFLRSPPLPLPVRFVYRILFEAAVATLPPRIHSILGLRVRPGARAAGLATVRLLRLVLGYSPSWRLAIERAGAPVPPGVFHQSLPPERPDVAGTGTSR